ncbi:hypothetical protein ACIUXF_07540 [Pseudomonas aeruginosa]
MSIDWSKAPKRCIGAFARIIGNQRTSFFVFSKHPSDYMSRDGYEGEGEDGPYHVFSEYWEWIDKPWDGQGLPPVGIECETWHVCKPDDITVRKILFMGSSLVVMSDKLRGEVTGRLEKVQFRPLRTPEQIAAEEREKAIDSMLDLDPPHESGFGMTSRRQFCEILFDAGYRRQEEEIKRNADRYLWLRNPDQDVSLVLDKVSGEVPADEFGCGGYRTYEYRSGDELDAAIDAAMERRT